MRSARISFDSAATEAFIAAEIETVSEMLRPFSLTEQEIGGACRLIMLAFLREFPRRPIQAVDNTEVLLKSTCNAAFRRLCNGGFFEAYKADFCGGYLRKHHTVWLSLWRLPNRARNRARCMLELFRTANADVVLTSAQMLDLVGDAKTIIIERLLASDSWRSRFMQLFDRRTVLPLANKRITGRQLVLLFLSLRISV